MDSGSAAKFQLLGFQHFEDFSTIPRLRLARNPILWTLEDFLLKHQVTASPLRGSSQVATQTNFHRGHRRKSFLRPWSCSSHHHCGPCCAACSRPQLGRWHLGSKLLQLGFWCWWCAGNVSHDENGTPVFHNNDSFSIYSHMLFLQPVTFWVGHRCLLQLGALPQHGTGRCFIWHTGTSRSCGLPNRSRGEGVGPHRRRNARIWIIPCLGTRWTCLAPKTCSKMMENLI